MTNISGGSHNYAQETDRESLHYSSLSFVQEDEGAERGEEFETTLRLVPATNYYEREQVIVVHSDSGFPLSMLPESMTEEWWPLVTDCFRRHEHVEVNGRLWTSPEHKEFYASVRIALPTLTRAEDRVRDDQNLERDSGGEYEFTAPDYFVNEINDWTNPVWRERHGMTEEQYRAESAKMLESAQRQIGTATSRASNNERRPQALMEYESNRKKGIIAWLLWLFLGVIGGHRFYLGNTGYAIAMLLLGWATIGIWPLLDGIICINRNLRSQNQALWNRLALTYGVTTEPLPESAR